MSGFESPPPAPSPAGSSDGRAVPAQLGDRTTVGRSAAHRPGARQLHTRQQVQYIHWDDGKLRSARVVSMKDRRVTVLDEATHTHFTLPYAAIVLTEPSVAQAAGAPPEQSPPRPPPEIAGRADFRVGQRASFTDQHLQRRVGLIVRINQRTATLDCDGQTWRVASACFTT